MYRLSLFIAMLITSLISAQNYEKDMEKAFQLMEVNQLDQAENLFERITITEPKQWLSHYYIAHINNLKSWNIKDNAVLKTQLDKAEKHINAAKKISKNNAEILVIQAQALTNWVVFDGATYGRVHAGSITELYERAFENL